MNYHKDQTAGYKKSSLPSSLDKSAEEILQGGKQSLNLSSFSQDTALEEQVISPSNDQFSLQVLPEQGETNFQNSLLSDTNTLSFVEANDFLPPISLWTQLGGMFMVVSIGVVIALSAFTPYNVIVQASAKIRPAGELRIIEAETEGKVVEIQVKENQKLKKGDIIGIIDKSHLETQKSQLQSKIQQAALQLQQIQAQITAQANQIEAQTMGINRTIASAQAELTRTRRAYQDRNNTANGEVAEAIANFKSIQEELKQAQTELISRQADLKSAQASLNTAKSKRDRYKIIAKSGALSQNQLEEAQLEVEQKEQTLISQQVAIQQQNQEIAKQKQAVAATQARLNNSQVTLNPSDAEVAIALENIKREKAIGQATLSNLQREKEALIQQKIEILQQQDRDRKELQQREKDLERTTIKATADGILFQLNLRNSGQTVTLGEEIAKIAPTDSSLIIKALVPAQEIDKVAIERQVQMKVSACPYPDYGTLKGVVSKIAPDSIVPQGDPTSSHPPTANLGAGFYEVTIKPESLTLGKGKKKCLIQLGMEGRADIIAQEETVLKFLLRKARLIVDF